MIMKIIIIIKIIIMIIIIINNSNINNKLSRYFGDANGALLGHHPIRFLGGCIRTFFQNFKIPLKH